MRNGAYDAIVVGGGPAGAAFVRRLSQLAPGTRILVVERRNHPRTKVCGDGLDVHALALLDVLFPGILDGVEPCTTVTGVSIGYPDGTELHVRDATLRVVPRHALDAHLWAALQAPGVDALQGKKVTGLLWDGGAVAGVELQDGSERREVRSALVLGAGGAHDVVRRQTGPPPRDGVAVRQYVRGVPSPDDGGLVFVDLDHAGYFWVFPFERQGQWWANVGWWGFGDCSCSPRTR